uniref:Uncharacterized protein n=1 Tax=Rangifer tarandus platyrhynchus TaxID=3082113 RepID=A0ACB0F988_RANTA|nr:unnamed protein product [Rangifer tarandus platyrhynchus]
MTGTSFLWDACGQPCWRGDRPLNWDVEHTVEEGSLVLQQLCRSTCGALDTLAGGRSVVLRQLGHSGTHSWVPPSETGCPLCQPLSPASCQLALALRTQEALGKRTTRQDPHAHCLVALLPGAPGTWLLHEPQVGMKGKPPEKRSASPPGTSEGCAPVSASPALRLQPQQGWSGSEMCVCGGTMPSLRGLEVTQRHEEAAQSLSQSLLEALLPKPTVCEGRACKRLVKGGQGSNGIQLGPHKEAETSLASASGERSRLERPPPDTQAMGTLTSDLYPAVSSQHLLSKQPSCDIWLRKPRTPGSSKSRGPAGLQGRPRGRAEKSALSPTPCHIALTRGTLVSRPPQSQKRCQFLDWHPGQPWLQVITKVKPQVVRALQTEKPRPPPAAHIGRGRGDFSASPGLRSSSCPSSEEQRAGLNELGHSEGCGCWSKSGSSSVTPRQKQEAATGACGHGGWTLPQATHAHGSVPTVPALQVEGGAQDRALGATSLGKPPGPSCWQGGDLIPCSLSGASISWFREGVFGAPWAAAPGPRSAAAP